MVWTPFLIVATLCTQIYILSAIIFLTYRIVTSRLSQIPTNLKRHDYATKRGLFIIYIGFFELVFVLIVQVELSQHVPLIAKSVERRCTESRDDQGITFASYGILACVLLSVVRCLAQSYVLERLSMPDVVSMTKVYLLPSTCVVGLLCVRLWFNLGDERDLNETNRIVCYQKLNWSTTVVKNSPVNFGLFILTFMTINFVYDFAVSDCEQEPRLPAYYGDIYSDFGRQGRSDIVKQANTVTKYVAFGQPSTHFQNTLIKANEKASGSSLLVTKDSRMHAPVMDTDSQASSVISVQQSYTKSILQSWRTIFSGEDTFKFKAPRESFRELLSRSVRLYSALIVYFVIFVGCSQCAEYLLLGSFLEDFTPIVFASVVIVNGVLRVVQIAHAGTIAEEEPNDVVSCNDQSIVALVAV